MKIGSEILKLQFLYELNGRQAYQLCSWCEWRGEARYCQTARTGRCSTKYDANQNRHTCTQHQGKKQILRVTRTYTRLRC